MTVILAHMNWPEAVSVVAFMAYLAVLAWVVWRRR